MPSAEHPQTKINPSPLLHHHVLTGGNTHTRGGEEIGLFSY